MNNVKKAVLQSLSLLRAMRHDVPDTMTVAIEEILDSFREAVAEAKETGEEVDWAMYADWIDEVCAEEGMPPLCGAAR